VTMSAVTGSADWCFAVAAVGNASASAASSPGGWTTLAAGAQAASVSADAVAGISAVCAWTTAGSAGTSLSPSWAFTAAGQRAGVLMGISQASNAPSSANASFPVVKVEAAFGALPGDPSQAVADAAWTDLTSRAIAKDGVAGITASRGRQYELADPEAGVLSVLLNNVDGALNPANAASPYAPNVVLGTPVRVSAYWEGRRYPVGSGYVERWPQDWPDLPQWGFSPMVATDQVGAASSANVPSAVQGEILADGPYLCLPFNDQYTTSTNTVNGVVNTPATACDGLLAINTSRVNQQAATYIDGTQPVTTGQSLSFMGDSGTGMGVSTYEAVDTSKARGAGAAYGPDYGLPSITSTEGISAEFWFTMPTVANLSGEQLFPLVQLYGPPYIASVSTAQLEPGWLMAVGVQLPATSGSPALYVQTAAQASPVILDAITFGALSHVVLTTDPGSPSLLNVYLNGVSVSEDLEVVNNSGQVTAVTFGMASWSYANAQTLWNYAVAYGNVYPYTLNELRVNGHYLSGTTGFSGDTIAQRFGRYLAWANVGLSPGGPGNIADAMLLSAAYGTDGSSLASAIGSDTASSGASWHAAAAGNLIILPRPAIYGQPSSVTFGDSPANGEIPYQADAGFDYDNTYLKNVVQATLDQGPNTSIAPVVKSVPSVTEYSARGPLSLTVSGTSAEDAYDAAYWNLNKYAQPQMRVRTVTVDAASYPAAFAAVLQTDLADVATVIRRPVGAPAYTLPVITQRAEHAIGPGAWRTTYQLSPYVQESAVLQADTAGSDVLGSSTVLAWLCQSSQDHGTRGRSPRRP